MTYPEHPGTPADAAQTHPGAGTGRSNGLAVAALVLAILAVLLFWTVVGGVVLGLLALIFGIIGARRARGDRVPHRKMSIVAAVLGTLGVIASVVIIAIGASILNSDEFKDFDDCVQHADTQSERDACANDFEEDINN
ncbi:hypothetical protein GCM10010095_79820 [Streptomyces anthocyanicus]|uniref:Integral membrane protein n=2 Tax=Streptomyces TaxID=1883 RepID=Q9FBW4_STRCO|nr:MULTISPECIES: hypothetical protein [Streptomyces]MYU47310.1 DUF4190 domain-containing protein [Streptomyces sp. SID7813]MDX2930568.1 DUF4190 domain-containing protein [Streptomyces sp. NRRL_B-16638]MDX3370593.1 DUF4190 domain-containing protein [Streptomyces sp. ME02-6987-2C]MDX3404573.1 DUF4190 domain-containing protein [Streptomyces sp. ME01-18h]MDX3409948.1 DUF4190 domain-containing protein [Streptomyces sp. ME02-6977A]